MSDVHADLEAERAVLGALLLLPPRSTTAVAAHGLRAPHFYWEKHGAVFAAMLSLADRDRVADPITVRDELERLRSPLTVTAEEIDTLAGYTHASINVDAYADRVLKLAEWRSRVEIVHKLDAAVQTRHEDDWAKTLTELDRGVFGSRTETYTPEMLGSLMWDWFQGEGVNPDAVPAPFPQLTDALGGGLWPGELLILSGPTFHGKSVIADQWADHAAARGISTHLYMTEMTAQMRAMRYLSRQTGVPFMRQRRRSLTDRERGQLVTALGKFTYGYTVAADWGIDDVVRDALRARYRLVIVDLIHGFHYKDERELDALVKGLMRLAHVSTTIDGYPGCAVIAVAHIKEEGMKDGRVPKPTPSSLKGGSVLKQDPDYILFVHQDQSEGAAPTGKGRIYLPKGRSGEPFHLDVEMDRRRFIFRPDGEEVQERLAPTPKAGAAPF